MTNQKIIPIYTFSHEGDIQHYAHFFFGVLIPLIEYELNNKKNVTYDLKVNIGNMSNILKYIFKDRVKNNYIFEKSGIYHIFNEYIKIKKNNDKIILSAYDLFNNDIFHYIKPNLKINNSKLDKLMKKYFLQETLTKNKNLERKQLYYTNLYNNLIYIRPKILNYFDNLIKINKYKYTYNLKNIKIVLINRKKPTKIEHNHFKSSGGQRRFIYNYNELEKKLLKKFKKYIHVVNLESMNIFDQYLIFNNARIIIGQHGAGLCNLFFMNPKLKCEVIEIIPDWGNHLGWFNNLAQLCNIHYTNIKQPSMTLEETHKFISETTNKLNIKNKSLINDYYNNKYISKNILTDPVIIQIIKNSGSINIDDVVKSINKSIIRLFKK